MNLPNMVFKGFATCGPRTPGGGWYTVKALEQPCAQAVRWSWAFTPRMKERRFYATVVSRPF